MSDVQFENFNLQATNHAFSNVWKWTRALKKAGAKTLASSNGTTKDTSGVAANDLWGGNADPAADIYPTALDTVAGWINLQLVSTLKLLMSTAPTGQFVRGEKVTQATSGAEGELLGYDFDGVGLQGHAVIVPRTGTFDGTHVITGAISGATFTPNGLKTFVREIVIWKSTDLVNGSIYFQCICAEDETANRFSVLATQSSCTATVAPAGGADASNNWFPQQSSTTIAAGSNGAALPQATINVASTQNAASYPIFPNAGAIVVTTSNGPQLVTYTGFTGTTFTGCSGGTGTMSTGGAVAGQSAFGTYAVCGTQVNGSDAHTTWFGITTNMGHGQLPVTNEIGAAGTSPDGTAICFLGDTSTASAAEMFGLFRCDDTEDADLDPFLFFHPTNAAYNNANVQRTAGSTQVLVWNVIDGSSNTSHWRGWRRRGFLTQDPNTATVGTGDSFASFALGSVGNMYNAVFPMGNQGTATVEVVACAYTKKILREPFRPFAQDVTKKIRKGSIRWLGQISSNATYDTVDGKTKMVVVPWANTSNPAVTIGPLDGSTVPAQ